MPRGRPKKVGPEQVTPEATSSEKPSVPTTEATESTPKETKIHVPRPPRR